MVWSYAISTPAGSTPPTLYQLTELGRSLDLPLSALERWVEDNWSKVEAAQRVRNQRST